MSRYGVGERIWVKVRGQVPAWVWTEASIVGVEQVTGPLGCPTYAYTLQDDQRRTHTYYEMTLKNFSWMRSRVAGLCVANKHHCTASGLV